jgi:glycosyltransferase involved in cell wall biosynthesis
MSQNPLVSIVIPTYNRSAIIGETIDNIFQQTYSHFELIIVDDGSSDDTLAKLKQYGSRIQVISQRNAGPAVARNRGAQAARGEIIAFQDSDDLWKANKIERQVALLEQFGPSVPCCLCNVLMRVVDGKDFTSYDLADLRFAIAEGIWLNPAEVLALTFVLFNQAAAIRRDAFEKAGGFDERLKYLEDYDLPMRLALAGPWAFLRDPMVMYRENSPESFHEKAMKEPLLLKDCELRICERLLSEGDVQKTRPDFYANMTRRLKRARRQTQAMKLTLSPSPLARSAGNFLNHVDHYSMALFRRSPWYPVPDTLPVGDWAPGHPASEAVEATPR